MSDASIQCPCGSGNNYEACCGPFLRSEKPAPTAESLMRSRYTAFALQHAQYLLDTWHEDNRPNDLDLDSATKWLGLKIVASEAGGLRDSTGIVQFVARYRLAGRGHRLEETSLFKKQEGRWYYHSALTTD